LTDQLVAFGIINLIGAFRSLNAVSEWTERMPRFRQLNQLLELMREKERIRNLGVIAHIDHGKTTLTDSLLAGAGLLSPKIAGTARVLDYLKEEQKRKITIKTANISLLYRSHVINLVDTPGHVDFTGKVTRALRAIDGAVVVVDAVEEIMAQTEVVTRQALEERVRPVLFVNKVDRLITELQLIAEQVEKKLQRVIGGFNDLIELYGEEVFKEKWKVDPANDSVAFGSALHGWGFTLNMARLKAVKFSDVVHVYKHMRYEELRERLPVYDAVFDMAIKQLPNPKEAQAYRIEKIWDGHVESDIGRVISECRDDAPAVMCVTNVQAEADGNVLVTGRLFSGTVKKGDKLHMVEAQSETTVNHVYVQMGAFREEVEEVSAGNIAALALTGLVKAGETLVDSAHKEDMVPFESISYVSEPVVTVAVEPKNPKDLPILLEALDKLHLEDPNLTVKVDQETGEYLLNGMGELHLEIALKQLGSGVQVTSSSPSVVYTETITKKGVDAVARSPNKQNMFRVRVEPLPEETGKLDAKECDGEAGSVLSVDEHRDVLVDCSGKTEALREEVLESIIGGFEFACRAGPLCGEPLRHVKASLMDVQLSEHAELRGSVEVMRAVGKAVFGSFLTAKPVLLEPVYKTVISVPTELVGECQRIVSGRRGKVSRFEQKGLLAVITCFVPVAESFGLSQELRSATSGRAFWQSSLERWERVPEKLASKVIGEIRRRKGLPLKLPKPEMFLEESR
jgi:elongation factor 2